MHGMKILAISMGVLIIIGLGLIAYKVSSNLKGDSPKTNRIEQITINIPQDYRIKKIMPAENRIIVHATNKARQEKLFILKTSDGHLKSIVNIKPEHPKR